MSLVAAVLFKGRIKSCTLSLNDSDGHFLIGRHDLDQTKINELKQPAGRDLEVAWLYIAMDDGWLQAVQISKCIGELKCPTQHLIFCEECFVVAGFEHNSAQVVTGDVIHNKIIAQTIGEEIRDFGQVGMIEARKNRGLTQELLAGLFEYIIRHAAVVLHFFESTQASFQPQIIGKINGTCTALPNPFTDLISASQDLVILQREGHLLLSVYCLFLKSLQRCQGKKQIMGLDTENTLTLSMSLCRNNLIIK